LAERYGAASEGCGDHAWYAPRALGRGSRLRRWPRVQRRDAAPRRATEREDDRRFAVLVQEAQRAAQAPVCLGGERQEVMRRTGGAVQVGAAGKRGHRGRTRNCCARSNGADRRGGSDRRGWRRGGCCCTSHALVIPAASSSEENRYRNERVGAGPTSGRPTSHPCSTPVRRLAHGHCFPCRVGDPTASPGPGFESDLAAHGAGFP